MAVPVNFRNRLAGHRRCVHYRQWAGGGSGTDGPFIMTTPPLRTFRTTPRDRTDAEFPASVLGTAFTAEGFLDTDGDLHIHGRVIGRVCADRLVLGSGGYLEGDVIARDVHIGGRLTGRIFALNVTLESSADVTGRIFHHEVTVEKGARVDARMPWRPPSYFETLVQLPEPRQ
ncbi:MAG TPA: polymer-forming cytoskeletal protein [Rhizomicrobium sp.]|nr:polymer-forming cytoskeletal protein [Rhizomicrobium sp.]